ncbi:unnamed protein product, partial [Ectocarpus sp. 12 AP-2014]
TTEVGEKGQGVESTLHAYKHERAGSCAVRNANPLRAVSTSVMNGRCKSRRTLCHPFSRALTKNIDCKQQRHMPVDFGPRQTNIFFRGVGVPSRAKPPSKHLKRDGG